MDYRMLLTYVIVDIFCIVIVGVIQGNLTPDFGSELEVKSFKRSLWSYILFMVAGLAGLITENVDTLYLKPLDYAANMISLSCLCLSSFFWFIYVQLRVNRRFIATKWRLLTYVPAIMVLIACISSPLTKWAFYINEDNSYVRGPLFMLVSGIPLIYDIASSATAYYRAGKEPSPTKKKYYGTLAAFIYFPFLASVFQIVLAGMPILAPAIATSYYIVFSFAQREMIYNDSLTGMNNRRHAMNYIEERLSGVSKETPLTLLMLDGDKFKSINDTYGHLEGDAAIGCMAEAIQKVSARYGFFCARYGGDEFLMIRVGSGESDVKTIRTELNFQLQKLCKEKGKPYVLSMSAGSCTVTNREESSDRIIWIADEELYRNKAKRKS